MASFLDLISFFLFSLRYKMNVKFLIIGQIRVELWNGKYSHKVSSTIEIYRGRFYSLSHEKFNTASE